MQAQRRRQREQRHLGRPGDRQPASARPRRSPRCRSGCRRSTRRPTGCPASTRAACRGSRRPSRSTRSSTRRRCSIAWPRAARSARSNAADAGRRDAAPRAAAAACSTTCWRAPRACSASSAAATASKLDQFLTSVRSLEKRVADPSMQMPSVSCTPIARPARVYAVGKVPGGYNRGTHAELMIDLIVMALQCDVTRVVSFMLDDARSDFVYDFIKRAQVHRRRLDPRPTPRSAATTACSTPATATTASPRSAGGTRRRRPQLARQARRDRRGRRRQRARQHRDHVRSGMKGGNHDAGRAAARADRRRRQDRQRHRAQAGPARRLRRGAAPRRRAPDVMQHVFDCPEPRSARAAASSPSCSRSGAGIGGGMAFSWRKAGMSRSERARARERPVVRDPEHVRLLAGRLRARLQLERMAEEPATQPHRVTV